MKKNKPHSVSATRAPSRSRQSRDAEDCFRSIVEDTPLLICRFAPGCVIAYVNPAYCEYFGKTSEELVGTSFLLLIPESDRAKVAANIARLSVRRPALTHEHLVTAPGGEIRWQRWTDRALFDKRGKIVAYQSIGEDITDRKRMEEKIVAASTLEKRNLARDLHDGLAQQLAGTAYLCHVLKRQAPSVAHRKALDEIGTGLHQCLEHVRHIANGLFPVGLEDAGLGPLLRQLAKRISAVFGVACRARVTGEPERFDIPTASHLYYLAQEAAMNAARHGNPRHIAIGLSYARRRLSVRDDGNGFDPRRIGSDGLGLEIMRYRASAIGGVLDIESKRGGGARIVCALGNNPREPKAVRGKRRTRSQ